MATKMACSIGGCPETTTHTKHQLRQLCNTHWEMLPPELRSAILAARHHGLRERATQLVRARNWIKENST